MSTAHERSIPWHQQPGDVKSSSQSTPGALSAAAPQVRPSLLHGDLWSGNYSGVAGERGAEWAILDPAVYYGARGCWPAAGCPCCACAACL